MKTSRFVLAASILAFGSVPASFGAIVSYFNDFSAAGTWSNGGSANGGDVGTNIGTGTGSLSGWTYTNTGSDSDTGGMGIVYNNTITEAWGGRYPNW